MLQIWVICPLQYKLIFENGVKREETFEMKLGTMFHDFARDFFDFVDLNTVKSCAAESEVENIFSKLVLPEFPKPLKQLCYNFVKFEATRYWKLKQMDRLDLFMPIARELFVEDPKSMLAGTIDRVDKMTDDTLCIVEYKTGNPQIRDVQRELAFYKILLDNAKVFELPIKWMAIYNPSQQKFFVRTFSTALVRAAERRINQFWRAVQTKQFKSKPGMHCTWCPVKHLCHEIMGGDEYESDVEDTDTGR